MAYLLLLLFFVFKGAGTDVFLSTVDLQAALYVRDINLWDVSFGYDQLYTDMIYLGVYGDYSVCAKIVYSGSRTKVSTFYPDCLSTSHEI